MGHFGLHRLGNRLGLCVVALLCLSEGALRASASCAALAPKQQCDETNSTSIVKSGGQCSNAQCVAVESKTSWYTWKGTGSAMNISEWFCPPTMVDYDAKVEPNTNLPPGKKEDDYARCMHQGLVTRLSLYNCRDYQKWTCDDCKEAYKLWACSMAFPKCAGGKAENTLKPCRPICNDVVRKCPTHVEFKCPEEDDRDYITYSPDGTGEKCNGMGMPAAFLSGAPRHAALAIIAVVLAFLAL